MKRYKIIWDRRIRTHDFKKISIPDKKRIVKKTESFLAENPYSGTTLKGDFKGLYRYRIGDWRIIYDIQEQVVTVRIVRVGHRREVYDS